MDGSTYILFLAEGVGRECGEVFDREAGAIGVGGVFAALVVMWRVLSGSQTLRRHTQPQQSCGV